MTVHDTSALIGDLTTEQQNALTVPSVIEKISKHHEQVFNKRPSVSEHVVPENTMSYE